MNISKPTARKGFNEAEASLPRNTSRSGHSQHQASGGFNEAEASLPRNTIRLFFFTY